MGKTAIDDLAVIISASTEQLANDLGRARALFTAFGKQVEAQRVNLPTAQMVSGLKDLASSIKSSVQDIAGLRGAVSAPFHLAARLATGAADKIQASFKGIGGAAAASPLRVLAGGLGIVGTAAYAAAGGLASFGGGLIGSVTSVLDAETGLLSLSGIFNHLKEAVKLSADLEQTTLSLEVMLGSAEKAKNLLGELRTFGSSAGFGGEAVQGSAKQLIAYGVAADQVVPTLKMLGDVAKGTDTPLKDLNYLYGTLYAQQRAFTVDIRQFANRGIPIYESLAEVLGKSTDEIKDLVEAGRIGRDEITRAFTAMTSAGGRFYKLTERQGQTFKGRWDAMLDAFQVAKTKLGTILIEELGLKDVAGNMDALAKKMEAGFERLRPAVRIVGELIKGSAQAAYDLVRAFGDSSPAWLDAFGRTIPAFKRGIESLKAVLGDAANFKVDPNKLAHLAVDIAEPMVKGFATVMDVIEDIGAAVRTYIIPPLLWVAQRLENIQAALNANAAEKNRQRREAEAAAVAGAVQQAEAEAYGPPRPGENGEELYQRQRRYEEEVARRRRELEATIARGGKSREQDIGRARESVERIEPFRAHMVAPPAPGEGAESVRARLIAVEKRMQEHANSIGLENNLDFANPHEQFAKLWAKRMAESPETLTPDSSLFKLGHAIQDRSKILDAFGLPEQESRHRIITKQELPAFRPGYAPEALPQIGAPPAPPEPVTNKDYYARAIAEMRKSLDAIKQRREQDEAAVKLAEEQKRLQEEAVTNQNLAQTAAGGGFLPGGLHAAGNESRERAMMAVGGLTMPNILRVPAGNGVRLQGDLPGNLHELAKTLKKEFGNPFDDESNLVTFRKDLDQLKERKLIDSDVFNRAWVDKVQKEGQRFGVGGPYQLPNAAIVGSTEDAQILTRWMSQGEGRMTTDQILRGILEENTRLNQAVQRLIEKTTTPAPAAGFRQ